MDLNIKEIIFKAKNMEKENIFGLINLPMMVNGMIIK